jgi:hypothetical protein
MEGWKVGRLVAVLRLASLLLSGCAGIVTVSEYDSQGKLLGSTHYRAQLWIDPAWMPELPPPRPPTGGGRLPGDVMAIELLIVNY